MARAGDPLGGARVVSVPLPRRGAVDLRIAAQGPRYGFAYALADGRWRPVGGEQDGSVLATSSASGFTGVLLGPFAERSPG